MKSCISMAAAGALALLPATHVRASYQSTILADGPSAYYRFSEQNVVPTPLPVVTNLGLVATVANGALVASPNLETTIVGGAPGALAGGAGSAFEFPGSALNVVAVPYVASLNNAGAFSVEFWAQPTSTIFTCPASVAGTSSAKGWLFYQSDSGQATGNGWWFRIYNTSGMAQNCQFNVTINTNSWYHVVGVFDGVSTMTLYLNGVAVTTTTISGTYAANTAQIEAFGNRYDSAYPFFGSLEEAAIYTNALTATQVSAHYAAATTNATGYATQILGDNPAGYWRFNAPAWPAAYITATNSGSSGAALNAHYHYWSTTVQDLDAPAYGGFETTNTVVQLSGTNTGGYSFVEIPQPGFNTSSMTIEGWVNPNGLQNAYAAIAFWRNANSGGANSGFDFEGGGTLTALGYPLGYFWNNVGYSASGLYVPTNQWSYVALTISPSQSSIYLWNGTNWLGATNVAANAAVNFGTTVPLIIGWDSGVGGTLTGRLFNGELDEVAIYTKTLTANQLHGHLLAALADTNPPVFTINPPTLSPASPAVIYTTESFTLTSGAYGLPPVSYQWQLNGTNLPGAITNTYSQSNVTTNNSGNYTLIATDPNGSSTSMVTTVTVLNPTVQLSSGLNLWLTMNQTSGSTVTDSSTYGVNGTITNFSGNSMWVTGRLGNALSANPIGTEQEAVYVADQGQLNFSTNLEFSLAAWVNPALTQVNGAGIIAKGYGGGGEQYVLDMTPAGAATYRFYVRNAAGALPTTYTSTTKPDGYWHQLTVVFSQPKNRVIMYLDGNVILSSTPPGGGLQNTNLPVTVGGRQSAVGAGLYDFSALMDDVRIYNRVLAPTEVAALYALAPSIAPSLTQVPQSRSVFPGGSWTFSAAVAGTSPFHYQWQHSTTNLPGATNATLVIPNVQAVNAGTYKVTVTNNVGSANASATLALLPTPAGNYETWVVGDKPEAYWRLDDTNGAILDSMGRHDGLPYSNDAVDTNGTYFTFQQPGALADNPDTCVLFNSGSLNEVIVPYSANLNTVPFSVECWAQYQGATPPTSYYSAVSSDTAGSSDTGYILYAAEDDSWEYWLGLGSSGWSFNQASTIQASAWTHLVGTFDGTSSKIYVNGALVQSKPVAAFVQNVLSAFCIGSANGSYFFNGYVDEVAFYTNVLSATRIADHYSVGAFGGNQLPVITEPASETVLVGTTVTLTATVTGSPQLSYQWQKNGVGIAGATNLSLILSNVYYTDAAQYALAATNAVGGLVGTPATLSVMPEPTFANLTNDLVLHLKFDGNYNDSSVLGNNGAAVNSPSFVMGKVGSGAVYVSSDSTNSAYNYVSVSDPGSVLEFPAGQDFTVAMWVQVPPGNSADLPFFGNQDASLSSTYPGYSFSPTLTGNWGCFMMDMSGNTLSLLSAVPIDDGQWHNLIYSAQRAGNLNVYVDGALSGSSSMALLTNNITGYYTPSVGQNGLGNYNVTAAYDIDDLGVWQRALSGYDALSLYTAGQTGQSFDVYGPVSLTLTKSGPNLVLTWQAGTLQSASSLSGPWTAVNGAAAPYYKVTMGTGQLFFRVQL